jgi:polyhydroxyalkanoate synthesis regulator phasin
MFEGKIMSRKEILDILVERASITEEERKRLKQEEIESKQRELERAKHNVEDAVMSASQNLNIPKEIEELLKEIKLE